MRTAYQLVSDPSRIHIKAQTKVRNHIHELHRLSKGKDKDHAEAAKGALRIDGERSALIVTQRERGHEAAMAKQAIHNRRTSYSCKHIYVVLKM